MATFRNTFVDTVVMYVCIIGCGLLVEGSCYLDLDHEELYRAIEESTVRPCTPGNIKDGNGDCKPCPSDTTMPYWNSCRTAYVCDENPCSGENEEVDQPCTAIQFATCKSITPVTNYRLTTESVNITTNSQSTTANNLSHASKCHEFLPGVHVALGGVSVLIIVILVCLCRHLCRRLKMCQDQEQEDNKPAGGRSNTALAAGKSVSLSEYTLNGNPAGTAVLIVNSKREMIKADIALSKEIFKLLLGSATDCRIVEAASKQVVETKITEILSKRDLGDCFACIILGHGDLEGDADGLFCQDDSYLLLDVLKSWFHGSCCKALVGKPKLFFHTCCRGGSTERSVQFVQGAGGGGAGLNDPTTTDTADMLTCYASAHGNIKDKKKVIVKGKKSYFDSKGSLFLHILKQTMNTWRHREDLVSILTEVNRKVSQHQIELTERGTGKVKQQSIYQSTLHRKFYLKNDEDNVAQAAETVAGPSQSPEQLANGHATVHHENEAPSMADHNQSPEPSVNGQVVDEDQDRTVENNGGTEEGDGGNNEGDDDNTGAAHVALLHDGASPDSPLS